MSFDVTTLALAKSYTNQHGESGGLPTGGAPYQQLVTDGEGNAKWEDRLAYLYNVNFINAQQFIFDSTEMLIGSGDLVVGETYKVIFDSTEYSCECVHVEGAPTIGSGDFSFVDYPFVFLSDNGQLVCVVQSAGTHTISLSGKSVKFIPERFIPSSFVKTKTILFDATDEELNAAYDHYRSGGVLYLAGRLVLDMYGALNLGGLSFITYNKIYTFTGGGQYTENEIV